MATIKELQEKIAKLEKGINSKATNTNAKAKARLLVTKFKKDIADLKAKSKPTSSKVSKAKEISKEIKRKYSKSRPFGKSDIYQDAQRPAKPIGRRTSAEGNTYYEYRENRTDRKQPPKRYPRLEDGGMMARGGESDGLDKIRERVDNFLNPLGYSAKVEKSVGDVLYIIEPSTRKVGKNRSDFFDGMQITAFRDGTFEVSEYMAGKNEDELHIYKETKSLILALKDLVKGNKRKPIKKYADGGMFENKNLSRDRMFKSQQKWEQDYQRKSRPKNPHYKKFEDGGGIDLLSDTSGAGLQNVGGTSFSDVDLTSHMDLTNPMFANGGELHRSQDGMYAKGGQTSKYKYKVILVIKNSNSDSYEGVLPIDVALFMSKGDALMCVRSLQEKAPSNYQYRLQDRMYAMGGILEHGLKVGDKIIDVSEINSSSIRVMNDGKYAYVNLSTGERREGTM